MQPNLANTLYFRWLDQQRQDQLNKQNFDAQQSAQIGKTVSDYVATNDKQQRADEARQKMSSAIQEYQGGNKSPLLQLNPELGLKFEEEGEKEAHDRAAEEAAKGTLGISQTKAQVEKAQRTAHAQRALEMASPAQRPALMRDLQGMAANGLIDMPGEQRTGVQQDQIFNPEKPTEDMINYEAAKGKHPGEPGYDLEGWLREMANLKAPKTTTNVNLPGGGKQLAPAELRAQQHRVLSAQDMKAQLDHYDDVVKRAGGDEQFGGPADQYLFTPGLNTGAAIDAAAQQLTGKPLGVLDPQQQRRLALRTEAEASLSTLTNIDLHELSGVAVSPAEAERFKKSLPSIDDPAPIRRAKIRAWRRNLDLAEQQGWDALVYGVRKGSYDWLQGGKPQGGAAASAPAAGAVDPAEQQMLNFLHGNGGE